MTCASIGHTLALIHMSSENWGRQPLWPAKDRLRSGNHLTGTDKDDSKFGIFIRLSRVSGEIFLRKLCVRSLILLRGVAMLAGAQILFCANAALAAPAFVQDNYAVPQSAQSSVTVPYTGTQRTGDLNVVIVGWS